MADAKIVLPHIAWMQPQAESGAAKSAAKGLKTSRILAVICMPPGFRFTSSGRLIATQAGNNVYTRAVCARRFHFIFTVSFP